MLGVSWPWSCRPFFLDVGMSQYQGPCLESPENKDYSTLWGPLFMETPMSKRPEVRILNRELEGGHVRVYCKSPRQASCGSFLSLPEAVETF